MARRSYYLNAMLILLLLLAPNPLRVSGDDLLKLQDVQYVMGTKVQITMYAPDLETARPAFEAGWERIETLNNMLSTYVKQSELNLLSHSAPHPQPVTVSPELLELLQFSKTLSNRSQGAFDVTVGPLSKLWREARTTKTVPSSEQLSSALKSVGSTLFAVCSKSKTAQLTGSNMQLDLGGIAKGYIADEALKAIAKHNIKRVLINAGGDLVLGDAPPNRAGWRVGVAQLDPKKPPEQIVELSNCAVATSGDAWQYVEVDGARYSHILDPKTGLGLTRRSSVTVIANNGMVADALASALSVCGPQKGLPLLQHYKGSSALIVQQVEGKPVVSRSQLFPK
jgi:thiamine biosynthesis lipoprotein